jgi:uncharacterized protein DUF4236
MGLYLRKSFRFGPLRLNLSKSGFGLSGGVTGARLGIGPRGPYVHAGRYGLYYRKSLSSPISQTERSSSISPAEWRWAIVGLAICVVFYWCMDFGLAIIFWLVNNPVVLVLGVVVTVGILLMIWSTLHRRKKQLLEYKGTLDAVFVSTQSPPSHSTLSAIRLQQQRLPEDPKAKKEIDKIEADVYQAVLDRVLDDGFITKEEEESIAAAERTLRLGQSTRLQTKKEIFSAAYMQAIADRKITRDELKKLSNLKAGLGIPKAAVQHAVNIVKEIIATQNLRLPLEPIPHEKLPVQIQKSEEAFYQCPAKVLSKRKSKELPLGYEYTVRRDGTMVLTNKRLLVVGDGTTTIRYTDIDDLDVDIDSGFIEISKRTSGRPIFLETAALIYTGRVIDLLMNA